MREISKAEYEFLRAIFSAARQDLDVLGVSERSPVESLKDGGMGSIRFLRGAADTEEDRQMSKSIVEGEFKDLDGMPVSFTVDVDSDGHIFELDIWRVDFEPLKRLPSEDIAITIRTAAT